MFHFLELMLLKCTVYYNCFVLSFSLICWSFISLSLSSPRHPRALIFVIAISCFHLPKDLLKCHNIVTIWFFFSFAFNSKEKKKLMWPACIIFSSLTWHYLDGNIFLAFLFTRFSYFARDWINFNFALGFFSSKSHLCRPLSHFTSFKCWHLSTNNNSCWPNKTWHRHLAVMRKAEGWECFWVIEIWVLEKTTLVILWETSSLTSALLCNPVVLLCLVEMISLLRWWFSYHHLVLGGKCWRERIFCYFPLLHYIN